MLPENLLNKPKLVKGIKKQYLGVWYPQFQKKKNKKKQNMCCGYSFEVFIYLDIPAVNMRCPNE